MGTKSFKDLIVWQKSKDLVVAIYRLTEQFFKMNSKFYFLLSTFCVGVLLSTFYFLFSSPVFAAEVYFGAEGKEFGIEKNFEVKVFLNTEGENVNAIEGEIVFPTSTLEFQEIRDGVSFVSLWIKKPSFYGNSVIFSGILPGGYEGNQTYLFSFVLKGKEVGEATIDAKNMRVLRNEPAGSPVSVKISPLKLQIKEQSDVPEFSIPEDTAPPEPFTPQIAKDPTLFDGKWFLVFATQDKGSGINHYEVKEQRRFHEGKWIVTESPYILKDQKLLSAIFVKAIDKKGNERITMLPARNQPSWQEKYLLQIIFGIIIIVGVAVVFLLWRIIWPRLSLKK